ncbi:hypothetical protein P245_14300 [Comamonas thiooxydans]|uniref:Tyr recombinase domain-containing protein n=1 Tax=Comamonas thiooxydans TaxID=363952 RepID=A0A0E3BJL8_9BURK|nr:hypothetical protein P245_14300 [Comamonas thiooxydans]
MEQPAHAGFFNHQGVLTTDTSDRDELGRLAGEHNYVSALRSTMDLAVLDKLLTENPVATIPCAKWQREPPDPFDCEEVEKIIDHARTNFAPTVANLIAFRFFSGLRTSEMVTLRWQSIDWNKMQVLIPQGGLRKQAKTNKARLVSLNSRALDALERQKEQTPEGATRQRGRGRHAPNHTQGLTDGLCGTDAWRSVG